MRWLWVVAGVLLALPASAREAKDYKASETSIVNCIEAAEAALLRTGTDITRQCIGLETQNCMSSTEDTYQPHRRMFCASAEAEVWFKLMQDAFAALIARYTKDDAEQSKVQTSVEYEPDMNELRENSRDRCDVSPFATRKKPLRHSKRILPKTEGAKTL